MELDVAKYKSMVCSECSLLEITANRSMDAPLFGVFLDCLYSVLAHDVPKMEDRLFSSGVQQVLKLLSPSTAMKVKEEVSQKIAVIEDFDFARDSAVYINDRLHNPYWVLDTACFEFRVQKFYELAATKFRKRSFPVKDIEEFANVRFDLDMTSPKNLFCGSYSYFRVAHEFIPAFVSAWINAQNPPVADVTVTRTKRLERWGYFLDNDCTLNVNFAASKVGYGMKRGKVIVSSVQTPVGHYMSGGELQIAFDYDAQFTVNRLREILVAPSFTGGNIVVFRKNDSVSL